MLYLFVFHFSNDYFITTEIKSDHPKFNLKIAQITFLIINMHIYLYFPHKKRYSVRLYLQLFVGGLLSYFRYLCLFTYSGVLTRIVLCFWFVCLRLVYPMLPDFLKFPFVIAPSVFSDFYLHRMYF